MIDPEIIDTVHEPGTKVYVFVTSIGVVYTPIMRVLIEIDSNAHHTRYELYGLNGAGQPYTRVAHSEVYLTKEEMFQGLCHSVPNDRGDLVEYPFADKE